jgi:hypothetical protein
MRFLLISFALLLSMITAAQARCSGTTPTDACPCNGSGCKGKYCCVAFVDGQNRWARADRLWPRSPENRMTPFMLPLAVPPVR